MLKDSIIHPGVYFGLFDLVLRVVDGGGGFQPADESPGMGRKY